MGEQYLQPGSHLNIENENRFSKSGNVHPLNVIFQGGGAGISSQLSSVRQSTFDSVERVSKIAEHHLQKHSPSAQRRLGFGTVEVQDRTEEDEDEDEDDTDSDSKPFCSR